MANLLLEAGVVFAALAVAGSLAWRLGQSVIPAYLLVGLLVGTAGPRLAAVALPGPGGPVVPVPGGEFVDLFAELGVVLLLFFIGVEFSLGRLLASPRPLAVAGGVDFLVNAGLGVLLGLAVGLPPAGALFLGGVLYPSSSAVVTKTLVDLGWIADPESEAVVSVLVFEDVVMAVYLAALAVVAFGHGPATALASLAQSFALLAAFVLLAVYGGRYVERLFATRSNELFLLRVVGVTVLLSGVAVATGVSEAVAAFFVGATVSESPVEDRLEHVLAPARDLFAAVFFFAVGLATDLRVVAGALDLVAAGVLLGTAGKLVSGYVGGRAYALSPRRSARAALALVARGEFSLVVAALAATASGRLAAVVPPFTVGYVLAMSTLGTLLMGHSGPFERLAERVRPTPAT